MNSIDISGIKVIAFDADDTLWVNEPYFRDTEAKFCSMLSEFSEETDLDAELLKVHLKNLKLYGYGIKGFTLSMIETALDCSKGKVSAKLISELLRLGKNLLNKPVELLEGVEDVLFNLKDKYKLVVATKGDLLDQERKLKKSGLSDYFHHIEIMSEKDNSNYLKLIGHLDIKPEELLMVGNSLKSDILPIINIGAYGLHIPYHTTWVHEQIDLPFEKHEHFTSCSSIIELIGIL